MFLAVIFTPYTAFNVMSNKAYSLRLLYGISLLFLISGFFLFFFMFLRTSNYEPLNVSNKVKFLATIMQVAPGGDIEKWDQVARFMNYYLTMVGVWNIPHKKFFDGKECRNFYKSTFEPLASRNKGQKGFEFVHIVRETNKVCGSV